MDALMTKRAFLAGAAMLAAYGRASAARIAAGVVVDVSPLRAKGSWQMADWIAAWLPGLLAQSFAGRQGGAVVHASINLVTIDSGSPHIGIFRLDSGATDVIDGAVWLTDARGRQLARSDLLTTARAPAGGFGDVALTQQRVQALCAQFAYWAPSRVGL